MFSHMLAKSATAVLGGIIVCLSVPAQAQFSGAPACRYVYTKQPFFQPSIQVRYDGKIEIKVSQAKTRVARFLNSLTRLLHGPLKVDRIEVFTERLMSDPRTDVPFWIKLSEAFGQKVSFDPAMLTQIPTTGPLIIVSNHPMNGVEGIALAATISRVRPDVKVVLTNLLTVIPEMAQNAIFANPYGGEAAREQNKVTRAEMAQHLADGKALVIFPAGAVSLKEKLSDSMAVDEPWRRGVADMVTERPETRILPIFVEGQPSQTFQVVKKIESSLPARMNILKIALAGIFHIREIGSRVDKAVSVVIGHPLYGHDLLRLGEASEIMDSLRTQTYELRDRHHLQEEFSGADQLELESFQRQIIEGTDRLLFP
ncbi:MAG: hypothetical protein COT73_12165 [Bdellovibrio sp. CG10_big_fil_rev_8_21_14_0_10_47_8]|nr:MAG: hypothetical protein COT73_12165 [Bdellovibrio sp. CG10_big_fil_rev_8_21_14_0_10_47_8]